MKRRILIVEDDEDIAIALATRLRSAGYDAANAFDVSGAVTQAQEQTPDLVLLDLMMPSGGEGLTSTPGFTVAERIRKRSKTSRIPIIVLTAARNPELRQRALQYDVHAFFEKPYDAGELLQSIQEALGD